MRLYFSEGEVDFIKAQQVSGCKPEFLKVLDTYFYVENPIEIVARKIHFRAE